MAASAGGSSGGATGSIRAGRAHVEMTAKDAGLSKSLDKFKKMVVGFGKDIAKKGGLLAGGGLAGLGLLGKTFFGFLDRAGDLQRLATKLGVTTEQLSEFAYAAETTGMSLEDLTGQFENLAERVAQGAEGSGEAAETFKKLGIDAAQLKFQNPIDQMITIAEAMKGVTNQTERLGMLSSLGGDQFQWMDNLFKQGPEGIRALMQEAKAVGSSLNGEDAANSVRASLAIQRGWNAVKNTFLAVGAALLPLVDKIESFSRSVVSGASQIRDLIAANGELVLGIATGLVLVTALGTTFFALGVSIAVAATAIGGIVSGIAVLVGAIPVLLKLAVIATAIAAIDTVLVHLLDSLGLLSPALAKINQALEFLGNLWSSVSESITLGAEGIKVALSLGDVVGAFKIGVATIKVAWSGLMVGMTAAWGEFKGFFVSGWEEAIGGLKLAWNELDHDIQKACVNLVSWIEEMFDAIAKTARALADRIITGLIGPLGRSMLEIPFLSDRVQGVNAGVPGFVRDLSGVATVEDQRREVERSRRQRETDIINKTEKALQDRAMARRADNAEALRELESAKESLRNLVDDAKRRAAMPVPPPTPTDKDKLRSVVEASGTRGTFSLDRLGLGISGAPPALDKIEVNTREARRLMERMVDKIDGVRAEFS